MLLEVSLYVLHADFLTIDEELRALAHCISVDLHTSNLFDLSPFEVLAVQLPQEETSLVHLDRRREVVVVLHGNHDLW